MMLRSWEFWARMGASFTASLMGAWVFGLPWWGSLISAVLASMAVVDVVRWPARRREDAERRILTVVRVANGRPVGVRTLVWATGLPPSRGSFALARLRESGVLVELDTPVGMAFTEPGGDSRPGGYL